MKGQQENPSQFAAFKRIAYPNNLVSVLPAADGDPMTQMMMAAANCDHIALPTRFDNLMRSNMEAGGYELTHVAFSLQLMKDNGCDYFSPDQAQLLAKEVANRMAALVNQADTIPDLRYEAMAFLLDLGYRDLAPESWITQLISEQQADGGWKARLDDTTTDHHASVLALWTLLGYSRPNPTYEPIIHRPY